MELNELMFHTTCYHAFTVVLSCPPLEGSGNGNVSFHQFNPMLINRRKIASDKKPTNLFIITIFRWICWISRQHLVTYLDLD